MLCWCSLYFCEQCIISSDYHILLSVSFLRDIYSESQVAELLVQILSAVDYLHGRRVIHLDLKSDNMLVDDCNHLKMVDLGSAQLFTPGQPLHIEHIQGLSESRGTDLSPPPPPVRSLWPRRFLMTQTLTASTDGCSKGTKEADGGKLTRPRSVQPS